MFLSVFGSEEFEIETDPYWGLFFNDVAFDYGRDEELFAALINLLNKSLLYVYTSTCLVFNVSYPSADICER